MLEVGECYFKELSPYEGDVGEQKDMMGRLPKIKKLKLNWVPMITHLWKQDSLLDHICASLETLEVWDCDSLINITSASSSFQNLTTLDVWRCEGMAELIASSKAQSLVCLVTMKIRECEMMKEIVASEGDEATYEIIFRELKYLELHSLKSLRSFCSGNCTLKFPSLELVYVSQCPRLKSFCRGSLCTPKLQRIHYLKENSCWAGDLNATIEELHEKKVGYHGLKQLKFSEFPESMDIWNRNPQEMLDFKNLEFLEVCDSNNLRCVFSISMALSLRRLQRMEIKRCNKMEQVIKEAEDSVVEEATTDDKIIVIFPLLKSIFIESCPDLTCFYLGSPALECPSLEEIKATNCPNMTTFVSALSTVKDKEAIIGDGTERNEDDSDAPTAFFTDKVAFPNLEKMTISHLRNVKRIWYKKLHGDSFLKLKELNVEHCDELMNIFSSFLLGVFQRLEKITVADCGSLEEVFDICHGFLTEEASDMAIQLRQLCIIRLPKLKHVWNRDPYGKFCFKNLQVIDVQECWSLKSLFPFSIAKGLLHLETLEVYNSGLEEIVSKNIEGLQEEIWFEFNRVSFLCLWNLQDLKCFYPGVHTTVWPVLKKLKTYKPGKIKIFGYLESQIQQPLFLIEKVVPQLEEVFFDTDDIAMICDGQFAENFFGHIKVLGISGYLDESAVFPVCFLQRFYNLEMLEVVTCYFKEFSPYEGDVGEQKYMMWRLPIIKTLKLNWVPTMTHLWKQDSLLDHICASLETLEIWDCDKLINLASASSSFQNLTTLDVWRCEGMAELIASSKAQSLVCLVTMKIRECEMMKEIVASEGDGATYEIIFRELKYLELHCLKSLRSFCSGNCTFKFPSLERVIVSQCPILKSFCRGSLRTPKLQRIYYLEETDYNDCWAGDLNATIEEFHEKKLKTKKQ